MDQFLQMNIFFFVTTIVVTVVGVLVVFILYRLWKILGDVEHISHDISEESALMRTDIARFRSQISSEGFKWLSLQQFFSHALKRFRSRRRRGER